jgi:hypothetical protein
VIFGPRDLVAVWPFQSVHLSHVFHPGLNFSRDRQAEKNLIRRCFLGALARLVLLMREPIFVDIYVKCCKKR